MNQFEIGLLDAIAKTRTAFGDRFFSHVTHLGDAGIFWILLAVALCGVKKTRRAGAAMAASLVCMLLLCNICLKPLVHRVRPYDVNTAVTLLIGKPRDFSFPSGHTAASFAGATSQVVSGINWSQVYYDEDGNLLFKRMPDYEIIRSEERR